MEYRHPVNDTPPLLGLAEPQAEADSVSADKDDNEAYTLLLQIGKDSLGGARPKAAISRGDELWMAKFTHASDSWSVIEWEAATLQLAVAAGIAVPKFELVHLGSRAVLLTRRFDRDVNGSRLGYISAMTLVGNQDGEYLDYLDLASDMSVYTASPVVQLRELFRRIVFSLAINNTDDHGRNHGFLRSGRGWVLSPAFDMNPNPNVQAPRSAGIGGARNREDGLTTLMQESGAFRLSEEQATKIVAEVSEAVSRWRMVLPLK